MLNSLAFCVLAGFLLIYFPPFLGMHRLQASFPHIKEVISFKDIFQPGKVAMSLSTFFFFFFFSGVVALRLSLHEILEYVLSYCCSLFS